MTTDKAKVLVTALNWGLGHATRCIPVIRELESQSAEVVIASDGQSLELLQEEFPHLASHSLPSYSPKYGSKRSFELEMALQIPKFLSAIKREERQCLQICEQDQITHIISDNRWGCSSPEVPSVFLSHQLHIKLNGLMKIAEGSLLRLQNRLLKNYREVWVPDHEGKHSLSGELSNGNSKSNAFPLPVRFIGPLSRLEKIDSEKTIDLLFLLSGPEPQRTNFEKLLLDQVSELSGAILFVRGTNEINKEINYPKNAAIKNRLNSNEVEAALNSSKVVIARSGYSSVMDFSNLQSRCILIPTPGQTEQEYLADRLSKEGYCLSVEQDKINIRQALSQLNKTVGFPSVSRRNYLQDCIENFLLK